MISTKLLSGNFLTIRDLPRHTPEQWTHKFWAASGFSKHPKTLRRRVQELLRTTPRHPDTPANFNLATFAMRINNCLVLHRFQIFYQFLSATVPLQIDPCQLLDLFQSYLNNSINRMHLRDSSWGSSGNLPRPPITLEPSIMRPQKIPEKYHAQCGTLDHNCSV